MKNNKKLSGKTMNEMYRFHLSCLKALELDVLAPRRFGSAL